MWKLIRHAARARLSGGPLLYIPGVATKQKLSRRTAKEFDLADGLRHQPLRIELAVLLCLPEVSLFCFHFISHSITLFMAPANSLKHTQWHSSFSDPAESILYLASYPVRLHHSFPSLISHSQLSAHQLTPRAKALTHGNHTACCDCWVA